MGRSGFLGSRFGFRAGFRSRGFLAGFGASSLVGAGALVTERKEFPARSLIVGSPAKAIRTLDDAAIARLKLSATHYVENGRRFRLGLGPAAAQQ